MAVNNAFKATENVKLAHLFQQTYQEALEKNEENRLNWTKSKEDHITVQSLLETMPNELSRDVMVPIGSKALMPGKIVHTNEILVCLGAGWFVKQSAKLASEICNRRVILCKDMLASLEKERILLSSRKQLPFEQEVFGDEIRESYVEEEESKWRVRHKQKVRDYRLQMKEQRTEEKISKTDEELWKHLELLELEEELQQELNVLHAENPQEEENSSYKPEPLPYSETNLCMETVSKQQQSQSSEDVSRPLKRRVSFVEERSTSRSSDNDDDSCSEPLYIHFSHSSLGGSISNHLNSSDGQILSPADIYNLVPKSGPKSILKRKSFESNSNVDSARSLNNSQSCQNEQLQCMSGTDERYEADMPIAFGDIIEHIPEEKSHDMPELPLPQPRPVSRFQAARKLSTRGK